MDKSCHWLCVGVSLVLLQGVWSYITVSDETLCGQNVLELGFTEGQSAALVEMHPRSWHPVCTYIVLRPPEYLLSIRLIPKERQHKDRGSKLHGECRLEMKYLYSSNLIGEMDLCNSSSLSSVVLLANSLFPHATVVSRRVAKGSIDEMQASAVLFTVVAKGAKECSRRNVARCDMGRRDESLTMCVTSDLICDGVVNCPEGTNDESLEMCRRKQSGEFQPPPPPSESSEEETKDIFNFVEDDPDSRLDDQAGDTLARALARYGPWGYLMLGTLLCGALLMVCGLWECCCRGKPRSTASLVPSQAQTVYIIGGTESPEATAAAAPPIPPTYDELDQPPDYNALFPEDKNVPKKTPASVC